MEVAASPETTPHRMQDWLREGLRAGVLLKPRIGSAEAPTPRQLMMLAAFSWAVDAGLGRFEVNGPAVFSLQAWLAPGWTLAAIALLVWAALAASSGGARHGTAAWFALWFPATIPAGVAWQALTIAGAHDGLPAWFAALPASGWIIWFLMMGWAFAVAMRIGQHVGMPRPRAVGTAAALIVIAAIGSWQFPERPWREDPEAAVAQTEAPPRLVLSQEVFEDQQALWKRNVEALAAQRPGVVDVYGLVFAPYAEEDVFLRESTLVAGVLADRFDSAGRVLHLVNHATTTATHNWATPANLKRAIAAIAQRMDLAEDVLVIYLTSHGASNFQLAAAHGPLRVPALSPTELRVALDEEGIRHRVIAISACYSGGWVGPLASDHTLVMTAADPEHTSYGCGKLSELTFFGRALFDEQLRRTRSFQDAFAAAVPVIRKREEEAGKADGFSNPQISVGEKIAPVLKALEQRLDGAMAVKP